MPAFCFRCDRHFAGDQCPGCDGDAQARYVDPPVYDVEDETPDEARLRDWMERKCALVAVELRLGERVPEALRRRIAALERVIDREMFRVYG